MMTHFYFWVNYPFEKIIQCCVYWNDLILEFRCPLQAEQTHAALITAQCAYIFDTHKSQKEGKGGERNKQTDTSKKKIATEERK